MTTHPSTPSIKTAIFDFCQTFAGILKPFANSLEAARTSIQGKGDAQILQRPMAGFSDVHHRLESLIHKVEEQQAYLIIFGPLKSGKSTLMNAISAAYVSEVTSLPAYPCLVHVKHGDDYSFVASRYNGEKLKFADNASLQALIEQSHKTLADRLREVEERGEKFDPGVHYPEAIRRVDVAVPTRNLKDSLTVLVDTPGLYTRMKFGYDLMTREFRNSAACAVFVVKTDNLFLEQVFEEFTELLDLFSRIFIVVNIDTNKRDLEPDGSLKPSLESRSPGEVIRAFESLVMSAPLRRAQEQGRLKIYPIDLLNSASAAMKQAMQVAPAGDAPANATAGQDAAANPNAGTDEAHAQPAVAPSAETTAQVATLPLISPPSADPAGMLGAAGSSPLTTMPVMFGPADDGGLPAGEPMVPAQAADDGHVSVTPATWSDHPEASFALFLKDLTDYLNSSDYLHEFMGDALLMGTNLATEIQNHCSQKATEALKTSQQLLEAELGDTEERLATVEKLAAVDIQASFAHLRDESQKHAKEVAKSAVVEALQKALKQLETWFETDASVAALQADWASVVSACGKRIGSECQLKFRSMVASPLGGMRINDNLGTSGAGLNELLSPVVTAVRATLGTHEPTLQSGPFQIEPEHLMVRKSLWDWLAFRSLAAVRRRIFGKPDALDREVPTLIKEKRLGQDGKQALEERIISELSRRFPSEALGLSESMLTNYVETLSKELCAKLRAAKDKYTARQAELTQRITDNLAIRQSLDELSSQATGVLAEVDQLGRKYHSYSRVSSAACELADADPAAETTADDAADNAPPNENSANLAELGECGEAKGESTIDGLA